MKNLLIIFFVLGALYLFTNYSKNKNYTKNNLLFEGNKEIISKILIQKDINAIELLKGKTYWEISGNDSLIVKQNRIDDLFDKVLDVRVGTIVSKNPDKWMVYSVDDSLGTHLALINNNDETIAYYVFGRSKSDYSHNNVRRRGKNDSKEIIDYVYRTNKSFIHHLNTQESFWGEKPKDPEPNDSLSAIIDTTEA